MARRTASEAAATRQQLIDAGIGLFGTEGYATTSAATIVAAAGVTRGALYHHFPDGKPGLFEAAYRQLLQRIDDETGAAGLAAATETGQLWPAFHAGTERFLELCLEPHLGRIVLFEAPAALGHERWSEIDLEFSVAQFAGILELLMANGELVAQPIEPLAALLVAVYNQAARQIVLAADPAGTADAYRLATRSLVDGLAATP